MTRTVERPEASGLALLVMDDVEAVSKFGPPATRQRPIASASGNITVLRRSGSAAWQADREV